MDSLESPLSSPREPQGRRGPVFFDAQWVLGALTVDDWGLGFRVKGLGFRVKGLGFRV